jgi:hypothetical protein
MRKSCAGRELVCQKTRSAELGLQLTICPHHTTSAGPSKSS